MTIPTTLESNAIFKLRPIFINSLLFARSTILGSRENFFLSILIVRGAKRREKKNNRPSVSGALPNHKHDLFHIRYFENAPMGPGYRSTRVAL